MNAQNVFVEATKILYEDYMKYRDSRTSSFMSNNSSFRQKSLTHTHSILNSNKLEEEKKKKKCCGK